LNPHRAVASFSLAFNGPIFWLSFSTAHGERPPSRFGTRTSLEVYRLCPTPFSEGFSFRHPPPTPALWLHIPSRRFSLYCSAVLPAFRYTSRGFFGLQGGRFDFSPATFSFPTTKFFFIWPRSGGGDPLSGRNRFYVFFRSFLIATSAFPCSLSFTVTTFRLLNVLGYLKLSLSRCKPVRVPHLGAFPLGPLGMPSLPI